jgi:hypothetical protein
MTAQDDSSDLQSFQTDQENKIMSFTGRLRLTKKKVETHFLEVLPYIDAWKKRFHISNTLLCPPSSFLPNQLTVSYSCDDTSSLLQWNFFKKNLKNQVKQQTDLQ